MKIKGNLILNKFANGARKVPKTKWINRFHEERKKTPSKIKRMKSAHGSTHLAFSI